MRKLFYILLGAAVLCPLAAAIPPDVAHTIANLRTEADKGDGKALFHLSTLYERGYDSIPADTALSLVLLHRSAETGYAPAENYLGYLLYEGKMVPQQRDSALYWLDRAARHGDAKAASNLGFLLLNQPTADSIADARKAAEYFEIAAKAQLPSAISQLADLYRTGRGVETDTLKAENLYLEACALGLENAEKKLLTMMWPKYQNLTPHEALKKGITAANAGADVAALSLYELAASAGEPKAYTLLGDAFSSARGTDYDHDNATAYYFQGAIHGDPSAQFILAEMLDIFPDALNNILENSDINEELFPVLTAAPFWYEQASAQGVDDAREAMRRLHEPE